MYDIFICRKEVLTTRLRECYNSKPNNTDDNTSCDGNHRQNHDDNDDHDNVSSESSNKKQRISITSDENEE